MWSVVGQVGPGAAGADEGSYETRVAEVSALALNQPHPAVARCGRFELFSAVLAGGQIYHDQAGVTEMERGNLQPHANCGSTRMPNIESTLVPCPFHWLLSSM